MLDGFIPLSGEETEVREVKPLVPAVERQGWDLKPGVSDSHCSLGTCNE